MPAKIDLDNIPDDELLNCRMCDLPLQLKGTWIEECVRELHKELEEKSLHFKPDVYLADEWLTPDQEPIIGVPFYLAHPRLIRLERQMMIDVEGGTKDTCMKLLRHEAGHAINYAFRFFRRKKWRRIFGSFSKEYEDTYKFRPYSRKYVRHLEKFYAQCHPDEDYAETFAVWLTPGSDWHQRYKGWKALEKLRYIDELMEEARQKTPPVRNGKRHWALSQMRIKLATHYKRRHKTYAEEFPDFHDNNIKRIFGPAVEAGEGAVSAVEILRKNRKEIDNSVYKWTGQRKYIIDDLLKRIIVRCKELKIKTRASELHVVSQTSAYITTLIMNYVYTGRFRGEA